MLADCTIGVVQMESRAGETEGNLRKILSFAQEAVSRGVSILCFPEMALHGYLPSEAKSLAEPREGECVRKISQCAEELKMTLLVGMAERNDTGDKPFLTQLIALPDGELYYYRKTHLGRSEDQYFTPGNEFPVVTSHGVRFAVGICWDWHFPEVATIYSLKGAELLFAPHASPIVAGNRREIWLRYLRARAYDNSVYLATCNTSGSNGKGQRFSGGGLILGPKGEICAEDFNMKEGVLIYSIAAEKINNLRSKARASMKDSFFLADRRKELYRELIELDIND